MKGLIGSVVAWGILFGIRLGLEWLADKYEFFEQWLIIATVALIAVSIVLIMSFLTYIVTLLSQMKQAIVHTCETRQSSAPQQEQAQATQRKKSKERGETRAERRAQKSARAAWRQAQRDKIQRVEAFEKWWKRERGGR